MGDGGSGGGVVGHVVVGRAEITGSSGRVTWSCDFCAGARPRSGGGFGGYRVADQALPQGADRRAEQPLEHGDLACGVERRRIGLARVGRVGVRLLAELLGVSQQVVLAAAAKKDPRLPDEQDDEGWLRLIGVAR